MKILTNLAALGLLLSATILPAIGQVDRTAPTTESASFSVQTAAPAKKGLVEQAPVSADKVTLSKTLKAKVVTPGPLQNLLTDPKTPIRISPPTVISNIPFSRTPNVVVWTTFRSYGGIETQVSHNSRVDAGASAIASLIGSGAATAFNYIALTADNTAVSKSDTVCTSEYAAGGLSRALASYGTYIAPSTLGGQASYILTHTWTSTTNGQAINKICAFNAASVGTLGFETILGSTVTLNNGDTGALSWTFQL